MQDIQLFLGVLLTPAIRMNGRYGEFLHAKVRLSFGFEVDINCCNVEDDLFLSFYPGKWIYLFQYRDANGGIHTKPYRGSLPSDLQPPMTTK